MCLDSNILDCNRCEGKKVCSGDIKEGKRSLKMNKSSFLSLVCTFNSPLSNICVSVRVCVCVWERLCVCVCICVFSCAWRKYLNLVLKLYTQSVPYRFSPTINVSERIITSKNFQDWRRNEDAHTLSQFQKGEIKRKGQRELELGRERERERERVRERELERERVRVREWERE